MKFRALWKPPLPPPLDPHDPDARIEALSEPPRIPIRLSLLLVTAVGLVAVLACVIVLPGPVGIVRDYRLSRNYRQHSATALALRKDDTRILIGTDGGGVERYDHFRQRFLEPIAQATTNQRLFSDRIVDVALGDGAGAILSAKDPGNGGSLQIAEFSRQKFHLWENPLIGPERFTGLSDANANAYAEPVFGGWSAVGTRDHGLGLYDWSARTWRAIIDERSGLPSSNVTDLAWVATAANQESVLWVGTDRGLVAIAINPGMKPVAKWWIEAADGLPGLGVSKLKVGEGYLWYQTERNGLGRIKLSATGQPEGTEAHEVLVTAHMAGEMDDGALRQAAGTDVPGTTWFTGKVTNGVVVGRYTESPRDLQTAELSEVPDGTAQSLRVDPAYGKTAVVAAGSQLQYAFELPQESATSSLPAGVRRLSARNAPGVVKSGLAGAFASPVAEAALWKKWAMVRTGGTLQVAKISPQESPWIWKPLMGAQRFPELNEIADLVSAVSNGKKIYVAGRTAGLGAWDRSQLELAHISSAPEPAAGERGVLDLALDAKNRLVEVSAAHDVREQDGEHWRTLIHGRGAAIDPGSIKNVAASGPWFACGDSEQAAVFDGRKLAWRDLPRLAGIRRIELAGESVWAETADGSLQCVLKPWAGEGWEPKARHVRGWSASANYVAVLEEREQGSVALTVFSGATGAPQRTVAPGALPFDPRTAHLAAITGRGTFQETIWLSDRAGEIAGYDIQKRSWQSITIPASGGKPLQALLGENKTLWILDGNGSLHAYSQDGALRPSVSTKVKRVLAAADGSVIALRDATDGPLLVRAFGDPAHEPQVLIGRAFAGQLDQIQAVLLGGGLVVAEGSHLGFYDWATHDFRNYELLGKHIEGLYAVGEQLWIEADGALLAWARAAGTANPVMVGDVPLQGLRSITNGENEIFVLTTQGEVHRVIPSTPRAAKVVLRPSPLPGYEGKRVAERWAFAGDELFAATSEGVFSYHAQSGLREGWQPVEGLAAGTNRRLFASPDGTVLAIVDDQSLSLARASEGHWKATPRFNVPANEGRIASVAIDATDVNLLVSGGRDGGKVWAIALGGGEPRPVVGAAYPGKSPTVQVLSAPEGGFIRLDGEGAVSHYERATATWRREAGFSADTRLASGGATIVAYTPGSRAVQVRWSEGSSIVWKSLNLAAPLEVVTTTDHGVGFWLSDKSVWSLGAGNDLVALLPANASQAFPRAFGVPVRAVEADASILIQDESGHLGGFDWQQQSWLPMPFERGSLLGTTTALGPVVRREDAGHSELWHFRANGAVGEKWVALPRQPTDPRRTWTAQGALWHAGASQLERLVTSDWQPVWGRAPDGPPLRNAVVQAVSAADGDLLLAGVLNAKPFLLAVEPKGVSRAVSLPPGLGRLRPAPAGGFAAVMGSAATRFSWGRVDTRGWHEEGQAPSLTRSLAYDGGSVWAWDGVRLSRREATGWSSLVNLEGLPRPVSGPPSFVAPGDTLWAIVDNAVYRYQLEGFVGRWQPVALPSGVANESRLWFRDDELWIVPRQGGSGTMMKLAAGADRFSPPLGAEPTRISFGQPATITHLLEATILSARFQIEIAEGAAFLHAAELSRDQTPGVFRLRSKISQDVLRVRFSLASDGRATCHLLPAEENAGAATVATVNAPEFAELTNALAKVAHVEPRDVWVEDGVAWAIDSRSGRVLAQRPGAAAVPVALHRPTTGETSFKQIVEDNGQPVVVDAAGRMWRYAPNSGFTAVPVPFVISSVVPLSEGLAVFPAELAGGSPQLIGRDGEMLLEPVEFLGTSGRVWASHTRGRTPAWSLPATLDEPLVRGGIQLRFDRAAGRFTRDQFETIELTDNDVVLRGPAGVAAWKRLDNGGLTPVSLPDAPPRWSAPGPVTDLGFRVDWTPAGAWSLGSQEGALRIALARDGGIELQPSTRGFGLTWEFPESFMSAAHGEIRLSCESGVYALTDPVSSVKISRRVADSPKGLVPAVIEVDDEANLANWRLSGGRRGLERRLNNGAWMALEWSDAGFLHQQVAAVSTNDHERVAWTAAGKVIYDGTSTIPAQLLIAGAVPHGAGPGSSVRSIDGTDVLVSGGNGGAPASGWRFNSGSWQSVPFDWLAAHIPELDPQIVGGGENFRWWKKSGENLERVRWTETGDAPIETHFLVPQGRFELDSCLSVGIAGEKLWLLTPSGPRGTTWKSFVPLVGSTQAFVELAFDSAFGLTDATIRDQSGAARFQWRDARWKTAVPDQDESVHARSATWLIKRSGDLDWRIGDREDGWVSIELDTKGVWTFTRATAVAATAGAPCMVGAGAHVLEFSDDRLVSLRQVAPADTILAFDRGETAGAIDALTESGRRWQHRGASWTQNSRGWDRRPPMREEKSEHWRVQSDGSTSALAFRTTPTAPYNALTRRGRRLDFDELSDALPLDASTFLEIAGGRAMRRVWASGDFEYDESYRASQELFQLVEAGSSWNSFRFNQSGATERWTGSWTQLAGAAAADAWQRHQSQTDEGATWRVARGVGGELQFRRAAGQEAEKKMVEVTLLPEGRFDFDLFSSVLVSGETVAIGTRHGLELTASVASDSHDEARDAQRWFPLEISDGRKSEEIRALASEGTTDVLLQCASGMWRFQPQQRNFAELSSAKWAEAIAWRSRDAQGWKVRIPAGQPILSGEFNWRGQDTFLTAGPGGAIQFAQALVQSVFQGPHGLTLGTRAGLAEIAVDQAGNVADVNLQTAPFKFFWPSGSVSWLEASSDGARVVGVEQPRLAPIWFVARAGSTGMERIDGSRMETLVLPRGEDDLLRFKRRADGRMAVTYASIVGTPSSIQPFMRRGTFSFLDLADGIDPSGIGTLVSDSTGLFWTTAAGIVQYDPEEKRFLSLFAGLDERKAATFMSSQHLWRSAQPRALVADNEKGSFVFDAKNRHWSSVAEQPLPPDRSTSSISPLLEWRDDAGVVRPKLRVTDRPSAPVFRAGLAEIDRVRGLTVDRVANQSDRAFVLTAAGIARHASETFTLEALVAVPFQKAIESANGSLPDGKIGYATLADKTQILVVDLGTAGAFSQAGNESAWRDVPGDSPECAALHREIETLARNPGRWRWVRREPGLEVEIEPPFANGAAAKLSAALKGSVGPIFSRGTFSWADPLGLSWSLTTDLLVATPVGVARFALNRKTETADLTGVDFWAGDSSAKNGIPMAPVRGILTHPNHEPWLTGEGATFTLEASNPRQWHPIQLPQPLTRAKAVFDFERRTWTLAADQHAREMHLERSSMLPASWDTPLAVADSYSEGVTHIGTSEAGVWFIANGEVFLLSNEHVAFHRPFGW